MQTMKPMTTRQRMIAVYRNEIPDRVPVGIYDRYLPRGTCERMARELGLGIIETYPLVSLLAPPWHLQPGFVSEVKGADLRVGYAWSDGRRVETRTYETPVGAVTQRTIPDPSYGSDWIQEFYVKRTKDYKILTYLVEHTVFRRQEDGLQGRIANLGEDGVVLGRIDRTPYQKALIELAGPERFLIDLQTDPGPVKELLDAIRRRQEEALDLALDSAVEVIWQPENLTSDMTPPAAFAQYHVPSYQGCSRRLREAGKRYAVHMDGRLRALQGLIARSPVDAVESFSLPCVGGDMTAAEARAAWPDKVLLPNFPASLCGRPDAKIEAFVEGLLDEMGAETPWMLQFSEDIPPGEWQRVLPLVCRRAAQPQAK
jgi:hypothetical protein